MNGNGKWWKSLLGVLIAAFVIGGVKLTVDVSVMTERLDNIDKQIATQTALIHRLLGSSGRGPLVVFPEED